MTTFRVYMEQKIDQSHFLDNDNDNQDSNLIKTVQGSLKILKMFQKWVLAFLFS